MKYRNHNSPNTQKSQARLSSDQKKSSYGQGVIILVDPNQTRPDPTKH